MQQRRNGMRLGVAVAGVGLYLGADVAREEPLKDAPAPSRICRHGRVFLSCTTKHRHCAKGWEGHAPGRVGPRRGDCLAPSAIVLANTPSTREGQPGLQTSAVRTSRSHAAPRPQWCLAAHWALQPFRQSIRHRHQSRRMPAQQACLLLSLSEPSFGLFPDMWLCLQGVPCPQALAGPLCSPSPPPQARVATSDAVLEGAVLVFREQADSVGARGFEVYADPPPMRSMQEVLAWGVDVQRIDPLKPFTW